MKKFILVLSFSLFLIVFINFANTQENANNQRKAIRFSEKQRLWILPQTHAELRISETFFKNWQEIKPIQKDPKSYNFEYKGNSEKRSILRIHDFKETDIEIVINRIKSEYSRSILKLVNEQTKSFYEKTISFLFFQDADQNVVAFNIFKEKNSVFAIEIETTYNEYKDISNFFYELINGIKAKSKYDSNWDKILLNNQTTIFVPTSYTYELPFQSSYFTAKYDNLKFQCFAFESDKSAKEIAYQAEQKFSKELGFKRSDGNVSLRDGINTVVFNGAIENDKNITIYVLEANNQCLLSMFEYKKTYNPKKEIDSIIKTVEFDTQPFQPEKFIPFAVLNDVDSDANPDNFTINMIFFDKDHLVIADKFQKGEIIVKIIDDKGKVVFVSDLMKIHSPFDVIPGGKYSEKLKFDGLWVSKLSNQKYKLTISASFGASNLVYDGRLTDLIIR